MRSWLCLLILHGCCLLPSYGQGGFRVFAGAITGGSAQATGGSFSSFGAIESAAAGRQSGGPFVATAGDIATSLDPLPKWTTYSAWKQAFFTPAQQNDPSISGPNADPDGDGVANLLEFAFYSDPKFRDEPPPEPVLILDGTYVSLFYRQAMGAMNFIFIDESTNLTNWSVASPANQILFDDGFVQYVLSRVPRTDAGMAHRLFLRLRVTLP